MDTIFSHSYGGRSDKHTRFDLIKFHKNEWWRIGLNRKVRVRDLLQTVWNEDSILQRMKERTTTWKNNNISKQTISVKSWLLEMKQLQWKWIVNHKEKMWNLFNKKISKTNLKKKKWQTTIKLKWRPKKIRSTQRNDNNCKT